MGKSKTPWNPLRILFRIDDAIREILYYEWTVYVPPVKFSALRAKANDADVESGGGGDQTEGGFETGNESESKVFEHSCIADDAEKARLLDSKNPAYRLPDLDPKRNTAEYYKMATVDSKYKDSFELKMFDVNSLADQKSAKSFISAQANILRRLVMMDAEILIDERTRWSFEGEQKTSQPRITKPSALQSSKKAAPPIIRPKSVPYRTPQKNPSFNYLQLVEKEKENRTRELNKLIAKNKASLSELYNYRNFYNRRFQLHEISKFMDDIVRGFYSIKTRNILPEKFDVITEVFNMYGLLLLSTIDTSISGLDKLPPRAALINILEAQIVSSLVKPSKAGPNLRKLSFEMGGLEKCFNHAIFPVEKCFLLYKIAALNYKLGRYPYAHICAAKVLHEFGVECSNYVWRFLAFLLLFKVNLVLQNYAELVKCLAAGQEIVQHLDMEYNRYFNNIQYFTRLIRTPGPSISSLAMRNKISRAKRRPSSALASKKSSPINP